MKLSLLSWAIGVVLILTTISNCKATNSHPINDPSVFAGQHVIYSYSGLTPPDHLFDLTRAGKVGGIILFKANVGNETAETISQLQSAYRQSEQYLGVPLLIMTDQEGGLVRRVPGGPLLSAKKVGNSAPPIKTAINAGHEAFEALEPYNVNTNLAPVLDIYRQEGDFIDQFQRSYGNTTRVVGECATSFLVTQQGLGIVSTAKHFPGLGSAPRGINTDLQPVTIDTDLEEIRSIDEIPYIAAIAAGIKLVMASWAIYPTLDAGKPAGLSEKWIKEELRGRLHFRGVTITDAIEAGALEAFGDWGERALLASEAGMDLILASAQNATQGEIATNAISEALAKGFLNKEEFAAATARIVSVRRGLRY